MTRAPRRGGMIALFVHHPTAANLVMALMLLAGLLGLANLNRQFFPDFGIDVITVTVRWPGAPAEDVERAIVEAIEPEVRFLDRAKRVVGNAAEGVGTVYVVYLPGSDMQRAQSEVEQAVAQITTLPEDAERAEIRRIVRYDTLTRIVLSGDLDERTLKHWAKRIREELLARGIDRVTLFGARDERIWVELDPLTLRQLDLTIGDVAAVIRRSSQDLPAGNIRGEVERQPRALGMARSAPEVAAIDLLATPDGRRVSLGELALVREGWNPDDPQGRRGGLRAIELQVQRSLGTDALTLAAIVNGYLDALKPTLPQALALEQYDVLSTPIRERINLLLKNGLGGAVLVVLLLLLFLNVRIAGWIAWGIPVTLMGMLGILWLTGKTINMISLFGMILAIGIVVDDAIVVVENAAALRERGVPAELAAEQGARRMFWPVTAATLTTIAAFTPILFIGDVIGTVIREIPIVVIAVLAMSLVECFLVLPNHLRHGLRHDPTNASRFRRWFNAGFERFRGTAFRRLVARAVAWRYTTLAVALAALLIATGLVAGGRVGFVFFQGPESDRLDVNLEMAPGTSRAETERTLALVEAAIARADAELRGDGPSMLVMVMARLGQNIVAEGGSGRTRADNLAGLEVELVPADLRPVRTSEFVAAVRERLPPLPGSESLAMLIRQGGPPGREVDIRLRGGTDIQQLKSAALEVRELLGRVPGVREIGDDLAYGKEEVIVTLTPRGRALGFTTEEVGRQLRDAFQGAIAQRFPRGDEEVEIVVRLDDAARRHADLARFELKSRDWGLMVPLKEVARLEDDRGFARITRENGAREVTITADIDEAVTRMDLVHGALAADLGAIAERFGLEWRFAGRAEEQAETLADLRVGTVAALAMIYVILAWVFGSFLRPFLVLAVVPFGLVGAIVGHLVMGFDLTILSLIALLGLSGILVNDSIVLVDRIGELQRQGMSAQEAAIEAAVARLRAVLLTSLTTIGGLSTILFETSLQALFLVPMAITLVFGLALNTLLVLVLLPALVAIQDDFRRPARAPAAAGLGEQATS
jgi:multidrug efflux pump subunit AcrB